MCTCCLLLNAGVAQLVERNLAKVEVESSRLFSRSRFKRKLNRLPFFIVRYAVCCNLQATVGTNGSKFKAGVAQLVERNLAKVEVESSRLFSRSRFERKLRKLPFLLYRSWLK